MKFISIVGSVEESRTYDPPIRQVAEARQTAELLGAALAQRGYGIVVYAGAYVESDVVRGYVRKGRAKKSIRMFCPAEQKGPDSFPEYAAHKALFDHHVDDSHDWEVSFYGSLARVDGVLLIGGARSSFITGVVALTSRLPVIALQAYGGSGEKIWRSLSAGRGLASAEAANDMAQRGDPEVVARLVDSLEAQAAARVRELRRQSGQLWALAAGGLVVAWVLALPIGYWLLPASPAAGDGRGTAFLFLLFLAPLIAGASGATVRMLLPDASVPSVRTTALGMAAGAIAGVLYVLSHVIADPKPQSFAILAFTVAFGFIAGLTFDAVFQKLEKVDALQTSVLKKKIH